MNTEIPKGLKEKNMLKTRSIIDAKGNLKIWEQQNYSNYDGCTCPCGHPPCSFCTSTTECDRCGHIYPNEQIKETKFGFECLDCIIENYPQIFDNL